MGRHGNEESQEEAPCGSGRASPPRPAGKQGVRAAGETEGRRAVVAEVLGGRGRASGGGGMNRIKLEHKTQIHRFRGLKELNKLRKLEHARLVSASKVKELLAVLKQGKPMRGVFVVNNVSDGRGERYRLLDGNHRLTAYLMLAEENPQVEVELEFHVFDHLEEAEEFRLFEEYNNVRKVTVTQIIGVEREIIPLAGMLERKRGFPCNVYFDRVGPKGEGVVFQKLAFAYLTRLNSSHGSWDARMLEQVK